MADLVRQRIGYRHRVVAQELNDLGQLADGRGMHAAFPVSDGLDMDADSLGEVSLHHMEL